LSRREEAVRLARSFRLLLDYEANGMKRIIGLVIGIVWLFMAGLAYRESAGGWAIGHSDIGFWYAVIGSFLAIAGLGCIIGTMIHTREAT